MQRQKSLADLRTELAAIEKGIGSLKDKRDTLAAQLASVEQGIAILSGRTVATKAPVSRRGKRAKNKQNLADALAAVLKSKGKLKVADAAKLALESGYKSLSSQFGNIVSQALAKDKRFKKISRGVYALATGKKAAAKKAKKAAAKKAD